MDQSLIKEERKMKKTKLIASAVLVALVAGTLLAGACAKEVTTTSTMTATVTTTSSAAPQPITLIFNGQEMPGGTYVQGFFDPWFSAIEERTGGRVKIEAHWGEELVKSVESYTAIKTGIIDIAQVPVMSLPNDFPMDMVCGFTSYDILCYGRGQVWWELYQQFPEMRNEYKGVKVLWLGTAGNTYVGTVKKEVKTLEDMKGTKFASPGGWDAERWQALGATPVTIGPADFVSALQNGILDGTPIAPFALHDFKLGEILHYITLVPVYPTLFAGLISIDKWNSMPADVQNILEGMTSEFIKKNDDFQNKLAQDRLQSAEEEFGMHLITPSSQELARWVTADKPVFDKFIAQLNSKGLPGDSLRTKYLELEKKYAASEYAPK
jgi:TRAP-type C4-dicarboxylate transport system substrate-binding protein